VHTKCGSLLSANLLGQMDSCSGSKRGRLAWGIPEEFRSFMGGPMMPLAVSGREEKPEGQLPERLVLFQTALGPTSPQPQDSLPFLG